ncbi:ferrochelatase [Rugosimonospora africana]|uniref:Coproporphyrin III ferrochelatase n=1 Tax=Rugosimonospora africana TaxID=556532 RepID=A0A8J3QYA2_9ACTN|nr:ferrochelatase [Rugosimonospora africana]GIH18352.1 ferrochelatase [Rugosimonospora africana]
MEYDAFLLVSFGGPEGPDDVLPFLRNVTRGRGVPEERLAEVAEHYRHFGGVSPINEQSRALLAAITERFAADGPNLPTYWGNRNWHPFLTDTVRQMRDDGVRRALAFVTSPYGSFSACRQYQDDIARARAEVGDGAPVIDKIRHYHDHPGYVGPHADAVRAALATLPEHEPGATRLVFTAHSIPVTMAEAAGAATMAALTGDGSGSSRGVRSAEPDRSEPAGHRYETQLDDLARLVATGDLPWDLVYQSRSGPPQVPWLGPDINEHLTALARAGTRAVVVSPIGFISDHLEVVWDLDTEAAETAKSLGLDFVRAATPGTDPRFVDMIRELVLERTEPGHPRAALGNVPTWDFCDAACCPAPKRPGAATRPVTNG